jgi:purine-cytosine permease-like protein
MAKNVVIGPSEPTIKAPVSPLRRFVGVYMLSAMIGWVAALKYGGYFGYHFLMVIGSILSIIFTVLLVDNFILSEKEEREAVMINAILWSQTILLIACSALFDAFFG